MIHTFDEEIFTYCNLQLNLSKDNDKSKKEILDRASRMTDDIQKIINSHKNNTIPKRRFKNHN